MPDFIDVIAALSGMEGDYPETMFDDILGAHESALGGLSAANDVAAAEAAEALAAAQEKINQLTAHNYELLMSVGVSDNAGGGAEDAAEEDAESEDAPDGDDITPDDLFADDNDKE